MLLQKKERGVRAYTPWQIHRGGLTPPRESKPVRIQVVEYDANDLGVGIGGDDVPHAVREFDLGAPFHDQDIAPACRVQPAAVRPLPQSVASDFRRSTPQGGSGHCKCQ